MSGVTGAAPGRAEAVGTCADADLSETETITAVPLGLEGAQEKEVSADETSNALRARMARLSCSELTWPR
jgi:hypothetical protein